MTKHIVGLIIFTLIVGTSAILAGLFSYGTSTKSFTTTNYSDSYRVYKKKKKEKNVAVNIENRERKKFQQRFHKLHLMKKQIN